MILPRTRPGALAAAVALIMLVAGCGGDDDSAETTATTPTTATTSSESSAPAEESSTTTEGGDDDTTTTEAEGPDADEPKPDDPGADEPKPDASPDDAALAEAVTLASDDFTDEWTAEEDDDEGPEITDCLTEVDLAAVTLAEFDSPTFGQESDDGSQVIGVGSTGIVLDSAKDAEAVLDEALSNQFAGCALDQLLASFRESGAEVPEADLSPAPGVEAMADQTAVLNGFFTVEDPGDGTTYEGEISVWFIRTENVISGVSVFDLGDTSFAETVDAVTAAVADKHAAELG